MEGDFLLGEFDDKLGRGVLTPGDELLSLFKDISVKDSQKHQFEFSLNRVNRGDPQFFIFLLVLHHHQKFFLAVKFPRVLQVYLH